MYKRQELIDTILSGRDVLGVMPTGAGKSVCYQLPAMMLPGLTLVISPLISLMKDQVAALEQSRIPAACINSSLSLAEYDEVYRRAEQGRTNCCTSRRSGLAPRTFWPLSAGCRSPL